MSGFVVLLLAGGGTCVFNRFWQRSLLNEAAAAIRAADALGITLKPLGFGPEVVALGGFNGERVRIRWRGGVMGARTDVQIGRRRRRLPLLVTEDALRAAVSGEE